MNTSVSARQIVTALVVLSVASIAPAVAQDVIGAQPVSTAAIAVMKVIAICGIAFGFIRLMSGRHTVEGLTVMGIGALGVGKTEALAGLMGLG